ncbi:MAG: polysaccharide deacetylase family protein [Treponema sp.]|nr:polysaccharide deacetylase family protein [Treponema sp.]
MSAAKGLFRLGPPVLLALVLASCTSRPAALQVSPVPEHPSPPAAVPRPVESPPPVETHRAVEELAALVREDSPEIKKYFFQDDDAAIRVRADWESFRITYDLENARPSPGGAYWEVDFSIREGGREYVRDTLRWTPSPGEAGVLLALDDDYQSQWRRHFDLFDRYGARVTFFVTGGFSPFCREALDRGHDIGCHTLNHLNLLNVSRDLFFEETVAAAESFRREGIPLRAFAYPYGFSEPWMREALASTFSVQRGFGVRYRLYSRESVRAGYIGSISVDNTVYKSDAEFEAALAMMLRAAKFIGGDSIVPLTTHSIEEDADWGISPRRLEFLLKTIGELKMRYYLYGDF